MTVLTRTVTVNAAFLQEIKEDNQELWSLVKRLEHRLLSESSTRMPLAKMVGDLTRLRDRLALHFSLEEAYGYFEDAIEVAPRLSARADRLRCDHDVLYLEICSLVDEAEQVLHGELPEHLQRDVVKRFGEFHSALRKHETAENQLIQEAFNEDLGGWD